MILVDATTLVALGQVGELRLMGCFGRDVWVPNTAAVEVTSEPAATNLSRAGNAREIDLYNNSDSTEHREQAMKTLGEREVNGDVDLIAVVLEATAEGTPIAVVSDDRRVRTVARGLGTKVTGTVGVVVRAVAEGELTGEEAKTLVRRLDSHGLHMTGELREKADELIEREARRREE